MGFATLPRAPYIRLYLDESGTLGYNGEIFTMAIIQVNDLPALETSVTKHRVTANESKASQMRIPQKLALARTLIKDNDIKILLADLDPRAASVSERKLDKDLLYDSMAGQALAYYLQRGDLERGRAYRLSMDIRGSLRESYEDLVRESIGNLLIHREDPLVSDIDVRFLDSKFSAGVQVADLFSNIYRTALSTRDQSCLGFLRKCVDEGVICGGFTFGLSELADQMEQIARDTRAYAQLAQEFPEQRANDLFGKHLVFNAPGSVATDATETLLLEEETLLAEDSAVQTSIVADDQTADSTIEIKRRHRGRRGGRNHRRTDEGVGSTVEPNTEETVDNAVNNAATISQEQHEPVQLTEIEKSDAKEATIDGENIKEDVNNAPQATEESKDKESSNPEAPKPRRARRTHTKKAEAATTPTNTAINTATEEKVAEPSVDSIGNPEDVSAAVPAPVQKIEDSNPKAQTQPEPKPEVEPEPAAKATPTPDPEPKPRTTRTRRTTTTKPRSTTKRTTTRTRKSKAAETADNTDNGTPTSESPAESATPSAAPASPASTPADTDTTI